MNPSDSFFYATVQHGEKILSTASNSSNNEIAPLLAQEIIASSLAPDKKLYALLALSKFCIISDKTEAWLEQLFNSDDFSNLQQSFTLLKLLRFYSLNKYLNSNKLIEYYKVYQPRFSLFLAQSHEKYRSRVVLKKEIKTFLFVIDWVAVNKHGAHLRQLISYTSSIAKLSGDYRVFLLFTHESTTSLGGLSWRNVDKDYYDAVNSAFKEVAGDVFGHNLQVVFAGDNNADGYLQNTLNTIEQINPDIVLRWIDNTESHLFDAYLKRFPLLGMQFNMRAVPRDAEIFDLILSQGYRKSFKNLKNPEAWRNHKIPLQVFSCPHPKTGYSNNAKNIRIVTALRAGRIERQFSIYTAPLLDDFINQFTLQPAMVWTLIGVVKPEAIFAVDPRLNELGRQNRLICLANQNDLYDCYAESDIYVHLPGLNGGGMGTAMAINAGLPVLAWDSADATNFLPEDDIINDAQVFYSRLNRLISDAGFRQQIAEKQYLRLQENAPEKCSEELVQLCCEAVAKAQQRLPHD